jgi:2-C-methyl-D-erythritol 2,4-cyclodiphosphate synthase
MIRIGHGYDSHRYKDGEYIIIGGIKIPSKRSILAHSDGDILMHALCDALLGASGNGDMGCYFDSSKVNKDEDSSVFLKKVLEIISNDGYSIINIDTTIIAEKPCISTYSEKIKKSLASILNIDKQKINIKSKTNDKLGYIGRHEGIEAHVSLLLEKK